MLDPSSIAEKLSEATSLVAESLAKAGYAERVQNTLELIEANEYGIALENLCSNLHEFSCPVPRRAYELLEEAGSAMKVDSHYWQLLKPQVVS
jgi:hypothetical protein